MINVEFVRNAGQPDEDRYRAVQLEGDGLWAFDGLSFTGFAMHTRSAT